MKAIKMRYYSMIIRIQVHHENYINVLISYLGRFQTVVNAKADAKDVIANGTSGDTITNWT